MHALVHIRVSIKVFEQLHIYIYIYTLFYDFLEIMTVNEWPLLNCFSNVLTLNQLEKLKKLLHLLGVKNKDIILVQR